MNNKGFAITGILYTLLILFLLIIGSFLGSMRSKNNYLEKSISSLEDSYIGVYILDIPNDNIANYTGKYEFRTSDSFCYSYLSKGDIIDINSIKYTTRECNEMDKTNFELIMIYSFEDSD